MGIVLVSMLGLAAAEAQAPGKWVKLAPFPEPAEELYGVAAGGKLYVFGGIAPVWKPRGLAFEYDPEAYDPASNRWTVLPRMPIPRHGLPGAVIGNRLHLVSGDVQSAGIAGMHLHSESHDAFEIADK